MFLATDKNGNFYQTSGIENGVNGYGRPAYDVDQGDVAVGHPAKFAEAQRKREREAAAKARMIRAAREAAIMKAKKAALVHKYKAESIRKQQMEERKAANLGEDPRLGEAVNQYRSGADFERLSLAGYGFSGDGQYDPDALAGFSLSDLTSSVQSAVTTATGLVQSAVGLKESVTQLTAPPPSTADLQKQAEAQLAQYQAQMLAQQQATQAAMAQQQAASQLQTMQMMAMVKKYGIYVGIGMASLIGLGVAMRMMRSKKA